MAGTLTVEGMSAGLPSGSVTTGPVTMTGLQPVGEIIQANLADGDNTFTVPPSATAVLILLGFGVTATVKLRTNLNSTDTGLPVAPYAGAGTPWQAFPLVTGVTSLILNSSAVVSGISLSFI